MDPEELVALFKEIDDAERVSIIAAIADALDALSDAAYAEPDNGVVAQMYADASVMCANAASVLSGDDVDDTEEDDFFTSGSEPTTVSQAVAAVYGDKKDPWSGK